MTRGGVGADSQAHTLPAPAMKTIATDPALAPPRAGHERRSAQSIVERDTELRIARSDPARVPLLPLVGAVVTAVIALAAAGALLA
jgi:hypothetical protein